jgi:ABC-2 type transport system permease protein
MTATLTRPATRVAPAESVPAARLILVELRKLADTRSGLWLLIIIGLATVGTSAIQLGWADDSEQTFERLFGFGLVPSAALLPVLGILSMTGEWSQRTALTTFTLVPARGWVISAKLAAGVLIGLATTAVTFVLAAGANVLSSPLGGDGSWHITPSLIWQSALIEIIYVLMGMGFGALLLNSPLAIVAYFALPTLWSVLTGVIKRLERIAGWLDLGTTSSPLYDPHMSAGQYGRLGASAALWVVLPLVLGSIRILRREVS